MKDPVEEGRQRTFSTSKLSWGIARLALSLGSRMWLGHISSHKKLQNLIPKVRMHEAWV